MIFFRIAIVVLFVLSFYDPCLGQSESEVLNSSDDIAAFVESLSIESLPVPDYIKENLRSLHSHYISGLSSKQRDAYIAALFHRIIQTPDVTSLCQNDLSFDEKMILFENEIRKGGLCYLTYEEKILFGVLLNQFYKATLLTEQSLSRRNATDSSETLSFTLTLRNFIKYMKALFNAGAIFHFGGSKAPFSIGWDFSRVDFSFNSIGSKREFRDALEWYYGVNIFEELESSDPIIIGLSVIYPLKSLARLQSHSSAHIRIMKTADYFHLWDSLFLNFQSKAEDFLTISFGSQKIDDLGSDEYFDTERKKNRALEEVRQSLEKLKSEVLIPQDLQNVLSYKLLSLEKTDLKNLTDADAQITWSWYKMLISMALVPAVIILPEALAFRFATPELVKGAFWGKNIAHASSRTT
ncbi:MAG: hypothetical protein HYS98_01490, partial [Deltaproteobacteria bacterium]|nr:hypothetical protein [Deltaproteobacteria bacterium]